MAPRKNNFVWYVPVIAILCILAVSVANKKSEIRGPDNLYVPNQFDGIGCDDSIKKLNEVRLWQLIKSNRINIRNLDELLGGDVDNRHTQIPEQIKIFMRQIECAESELKRRGKL